MSIREIPLRRVKITDAFWSPRQALMTDVTIPYMEKILRDEVPEAEKSHAVDNFRMAAGEADGSFYGMVFQDSDVAKWLEAAAYSLALKPDEALSRRVDGMVALVGRCQQPNGYLNTYFTVKEPENKWKNLLECHELYCAGHLMEAAAALHEAAGKDELLRICTRLADHICDRFEKEEGIPGHQEIEIGLLRMYRATGNARYRDMALRFLNLRGQDPEWFAKHTPAHPSVHYGGYDILPEDTVYNQSDRPVRKQTKARGHAVRQLYMLTAMADAAAETGDRDLLEACRRLFENITRRQMYVTGAVGASAWHEAFTVDYDLPGDRAYGETCASVAMVFFAHQMLKARPEGQYADLIELELYNAALAGMQLDGKRFFYVNPLEVDRSVSGKVPGYEHVLPERPRWHSCACCPPNLARLIGSLGRYLWSEDDRTVYSHLLIGSEADTQWGRIRLESRYPWEGRAVYTVQDGGDFSLAIHIPGYVSSFTLTVNGSEAAPAVRDGYACLNRVWKPGDTVALSFDLPVRRLYANPRVRSCAGKAALARGPVVYCFEEADNEAPLSSLSLPRDQAVETVPAFPGLPGDLVCLRMRGKRDIASDALYGALPPRTEDCTLHAVPYFSWANRKPGNMQVWIREI